MSGADAPARALAVIPPILTAARGYALHPEILLNRPDTKFNIASVTKMLTAVAIMQLVAAGKLDLHTPVAAYNPDLPYASQITIHQLLTHTAGFDRYWNDAYRAALGSAHSKRLSDIICHHASRISARHTSSLMKFGYVVPGALIEQASGQSYYDYLQQAIYQPLGMRYRAFRNGLALSPTAIGYTKNRTGRKMDSGAPITLSMQLKAAHPSIAFRPCKISFSFARRSRPGAC
jgi:CubicO group peptidase (beta-lactamase class C family)